MLVAWTSSISSHGNLLRLKEVNQWIGDQFMYNRCSCRSVPQISQCTSPISHYATFCNRNFRHKMLHREICLLHYRIFEIGLYPTSPSHSPPVSLPADMAAGLRADGHHHGIMWEQDLFPGQQEEDWVPETSGRQQWGERYSWIWSAHQGQGGWLAGKKCGFVSLRFILAPKRCDGNLNSVIFQPVLTFVYRYLEHFLWKFTRWMLQNPIDDLSVFDSGYGFVPAGNEPLPGPVLTHIYVAACHY